MSSAAILLLALIVIFVVIPIGFRLLLKFFEPGVDDTAQRRRLFPRRKSDTGEWGRDDTGIIQSSRWNRLLPHQRARRSGRMR